MLQWEERLPPHRTTADWFHERNTAMRGLVLGILWATACCYIALASGNPLGAATHTFYNIVTTR